jgi:hypothetical protein
MLAIASTPAPAALRDYTVKWIPSQSASVEHYMLSVGSSAGSYTAEFDLGLPEAVGGQMQYVMELEDSVDLYLSLRAVNTATLYSGYSNEIVVAKAAPPAPGPDDLGIASIDGLGSAVAGSISVMASAHGVTESVLFLVDGSQLRVDSQLPYTLSGDASNLFDTKTLSDGEHTLTAVAFSGDGGAGVQGGALSQTFTVRNSPIIPDPGPGDGGGGDTVMPSVVGLVASADGEISLVDMDGGVTDIHIEPLSAAGDLRPAWCDLNGDDQADLVIGFGPGSRARLLILHMQDHQVTSSEILKPEKIWKERGFARKYRQANGETYPACGDIDGDGLDEIVIGLGDEGMGKLIILDDMNTGFQRINVKLSGENASFFLAGADHHMLMANATSIPALGDIDGDGLDELVIGRGPGAGERLAIFDDLKAGFATLRAGMLFADGPLEIPGAAAIGADGTAWPALGDIDGDGRDEILVGLGEGSGGRLFLFEDLQGGFEQIVNDATIDGSYIAGDNVYRDQNGQLIPSAADIDGDGRDEIGLGFGIGAEERMQILDDLESGLAPHPDTSGLDGMIDPQLDLMMAPALQP